jgi:signal transduction histidine kinase
MVVGRPRIEEGLHPLVEGRLRAALHEIRQPLAAVLALAEAARSTPGVGADVRAYLEQIIEQAREVASAATSVLAPPPPSSARRTESIDVDEVVDSVVAGTRVTWTGDVSRRGTGGTVRVTGGGRTDLRRCLVDVVDNAVRAAGSDGTVTVEVHRDDEFLRVVVEDDGPGFGRVPRGAGLGLALTREALAGMGAELHLGGPPSNSGTRVTLALPLDPARPAGVPVRSAPAEQVRT